MNLTKRVRRSWRVTALGVVATTFASAPPVLANHLIKVTEVLRSWNGDPTIAFIELRLLADGQGKINQSRIRFHPAGGGKPILLRILDRDVTNDGRNARVLLATSALAARFKITPDFDIAPLPDGPGSICYEALRPNGAYEINEEECLEWGGTWKAPDNWSLVRTRDGLDGVLEPTAQNNSGNTVSLDTIEPSSCENGLREPWEPCDGSDLAGKTCSDLGFFAGSLACDRCHNLDPGRCHNCGNGTVESPERCDGGNLRGKSCMTRGYTTGELACDERCEWDETRCEGRQLPGGRGKASTECALEWSVVSENAGAARRPQRCVDGNKACDVDEEASGACGVQVTLCFNREDDHLRRCKPTSVGTFAVSSSGAGRVDPAEQRNTKALLEAVAMLGGEVTDGEVWFPDGLETPDACTMPVTITVPACEYHGRSGKCRGTTKLVTETIAPDGRRRDPDVISLQCMPTE